MNFNPFGTKKKGELVTLTATQRADMESPEYPSNIVGIKEDILYYLKSHPAQRPEQIANGTIPSHTYSAVMATLKDLEAEHKVEWTPF